MRSLSYKSFKVLNSKILFFSLIISLIFLIILSNDSKNNFFIFILFHSIIGLFSLYLIMGNRFGLLAQTLGIFFLVAYSFYPILESVTGTIYWGGKILGYTPQLISNWAIIVFQILFILGYTLKKK